MPILTKDSRRFIEKTLKIKEKYRGFPNLYEACERVFPGAWDTNITVRNINISKCDTIADIFDSNYIFTNITLYFPEVTIQGNNVSHTITDLYVRLRIEWCDSYCYPDIWGVRSSRTVEELKKKYIHSHLSGNNHNTFSSFCLGEGPLVSLRHNIINKNTSVEEYEYFLHLIKSYVSWESASGVPYLYIRDLGTSTLEGNCPKYVVEYIFNTFEFHNLKFKIRNNKIEVIPTEELENEIYNYIKNRHYSVYLCAKNDVGDYIQSKHIEVSQWMLDLEGEEVLEFKGESIKFKISNKQNIKNYDYNVPNPTITKGICKLLSEKLTQAQIKRSSIRQENKAINSQESIPPDTVLV